MSENIEGKAVVITGASSGLGEATARLLARQGASVAMGARRVDRLQSLADELNDRGARALAVATDVTVRDQVKELVDAAVQAYGRIDVMINNAGLMPQAPLERLKVDEWDRMIDEENAIPAESFAKAVAFAISQPKEVDIYEILFRPSRQEV